MRRSSKPSSSHDPSAPPRVRPARVALPPLRPDEEATRLVPSKRPEPSQGRGPSRRSTWPARPTKEDESRTIVRPSQAPPRVEPRAVEPAPQRALPALARATPPPVMSRPPVRVDMPTIVTAPRPSARRPAIVWAAAFIAVGVLAGFGSSMLVRSSERDSIVSATTSLADPARTQGSPAVVAGGTVPVAAPTAPAAPVAASPVAAPVAAGPVAASPVAAASATIAVSNLPVAPAAGPAHATIAAEDLPVAAAARAPVAEPRRTYAAPTHAAPTRSRPAVASDQTTTTAAAPPPKVARSKAPAGAGKDDMDSAAAADALARAQLEAALK